MLIFMENNIYNFIWKNILVFKLKLSSVSLVFHIHGVSIYPTKFLNTYVYHILESNILFTFPKYLPSILIALWFRSRLVIFPVHFEIRTKSSPLYRGNFFTLYSLSNIHTLCTNPQFKILLRNALQKLRKVFLLINFCNAFLRIILS